jgi:hypothetical protein
MSVTHNNHYSKAHTLSMCGILCLLFACGQGEDYYLESNTSLKDQTEVEQTTMLSQILSADGSSNPQASITNIPGPITTLNGLPVSARGNHSQIPVEEIRPATPQIVEEPPEQEFWAPEDDESEIPDFIEVPEVDEGVTTPTPVSVMKRKPIQTLTSEEFDQVCKAIDIMYEDETAETLLQGACAYDYARQDFDQNDVELFSCERELDDCYDERTSDVADAHIPIALCGAVQAVPSNCEINFAQVQTCLTAHRDSQAALAQQNMCALNIDTITEARSLVHEHFQAQKCLQSLEHYCPALAVIDVE